MSITILGRGRNSPRSDIPLEGLLPHLERNQARILVALLAYGTLTALEESRITVGAAYRAVLNWRVLLYFSKRLKPPDRVLEDVISHSVELGTISRHFGEQAVPPTCAEIKAKLASWLVKNSGKPALRSSAHYQNTDLPLVEEVLSHLTREHTRVLVALLMYGILAAIEKDLITVDVARRVVLNQHVSLYLKQKLKPRDPTLEKALSCSVQLDAVTNTTRRRDLLRICAGIKAKLKE